MLCYNNYDIIGQNFLQIEFCAQFLDEYTSTSKRQKFSDNADELVTARASQTDGEIEHERRILNTTLGNLTHLVFSHNNTNYCRY